MRSVHLVSLVSLLALACGGATPPSVTAPTTRERSADDATPVLAESDGGEPDPSAKRADAEGEDLLREIARAMAAAYEREGPGSAGPTHKLCPSAAPVPAAIEDVTDRTYTSSPREWREDAGWSCLRFERDTPQSWQLEVKADVREFTAFARRVEGGRPLELRIAGRVHVTRGGLELTPVSHHG